MEVTKKTGGNRRPEKNTEKRTKQLYRRRKNNPSSL